MNDNFSGEHTSVSDSDTELITQYYKVAKLTVISQGTISNNSKPKNWGIQSRKFTKRASAVDWQLGLLTRSVIVACGAVEFQLR